MSEILSCAINSGVRVAFEDRVKTSASSKGNQIKWRRSGGIWAKADDMGYEGLAEQTASLLLAHSNFDEYAKYRVCKIHEDDVVYTGCVSADFLAAGEELITLARLFQADVLRYDKDFETLSASQRLEYLIENTERITGFNGFGKWLGMLFEFDAFILNEDRHLHNIAVVKKPDGAYKPMPVFDNGAAFLSDTARDYPLTAGMNLARLVSRVKSKPIVTEFDKQLAAVDEVVGLSLKFNCSPDAIDVQSQEYPEQIATRVKNIITHQALRYPHLFLPTPKRISPDPLARD
jgi:hypothetical protein